MAPLESTNAPLAVPTSRDEATPALRRPVTSLRGVGAERAAQLARLEIHTIEDLLLHRPRRYEDRRHFRVIAELSRDEAATARGTIVAQGLRRFRGGRKSVFEFVLDDGSARLHCRWWNLPFMEKYFAVGDEVFVFGKLVETKPRTMDHPETEVIERGERKLHPHQSHRTDLSADRRSAPTLAARVHLADAGNISIANCRTDNRRPTRSYFPPAPTRSGWCIFPKK